MKQSSYLDHSGEFLVDHRYLANSFDAPSTSEDNFSGIRAKDHYPPHLEIEPTHLAIHINIDIEQQTLTGKVIHTLIARKDLSQSMTLHAEDFSDLVIHSPGVSHSYDGSLINLYWEKPFSKEEVRTLEITYKVQKPITGLFFMKPCDKDPQKSYYAATDHETERARYWLPTIDLPNVRTTLDFHITALDRLVILANGSLISEVKNNNGTKTAHWQLKQKCPSYLVCFAVGDFSRFNAKPFEGIPIAAFATKDFSPEDLERTFGATSDMLAWMTKRLGVPFPYPKYYQFALPNFGGAMENISLVSWNDYFMCTERNHSVRSRITDQINVHEMAHSYFGDSVVCRDFAHAWLKESWATYIESCWLEDTKGIDEQRYNLFQNAQAYINEADNRYQRPMVTRRFTSSWQMYDRHLYPGGACRLHTLRHELGDDCFWAGVTDYLMTFAEQVVETDDFRKIMEKHSGRSLQKFFDQWIHSAGYPHLKVSFKYDKSKKTGTFDIEQKQAAGSESKSPKHLVTIFELSTDLGWTLNGRDFSLPIKITEQKQSFTINLEEDPEQVRFDPHGRILHKLEFNPGETKLKTQLSNAKDVVGRILASNELCKLNKRSATQAVIEAYAKEKFWGVKVQFISALAKINSNESIEGLIHIAEQENHSLVMDIAFWSLGSIRDPRVAKVCESRIRANSLTPDAKGNALLALGFQRDHSLTEFIQKYAETSDPQCGIVQIDGLTALGMTRNPTVSEYLVARSQRGRTHFRAREGSLTGLGAIAPYLEKGSKTIVEECLMDHLRDNDSHISKEAVRALGAANVHRAAKLIETYKEGLSIQEQTPLESIIKGLKAGDHGKIPALEKQLEELNEKFRKLQSKFEDLDSKNIPVETKNTV